MKNYYELRFFENPLRDDIDINTILDDEYKNKKQYHYFKIIYGTEVDKIVNPKIIEWANRKHIPINDVYIFVNNGVLLPHVDEGSQEKTALTLNWCIQNPDADMIWYKPKAGISLAEALTEDSTEYCRTYNLDYMEVIETHQVIGPTLVNTNIPHAIKLHDSNIPRIVVSIRFSNNFSTWEEMVNFFKPFIKK
jgi:hypothetical protein